MRREFAAIIIGFGSTIASIVSPYLIPNMPHLVALILLGIGLVLILYGLIIFFLPLSKRQKSYRKIDIQKLRLADGALENILPNQNNVLRKQIIFTLINECGQDLKKCFILLDKHKARNDELSKGKWQLQGDKIYDKPFRWEGENIPEDGKIDLDNNNRASFVLIDAVVYPVLNVTENRNDSWVDYNFAFLGKEGVRLFIGWDNSLLIGIRAEDENENELLVQYSIHLMPSSNGQIFDWKIDRIEK
jgi:hypothetical protein